MTVADLFVNIAIKGATETTKALGSVVNSLTSVSSSGIVAKAAIFGIVYGLEQMARGAGERGMDLQKLANYTDISSDTFQKLAIFLQKGGVAAKDANGAILTLQASMEQLAEGRGGPGMLRYLSETVGGLDASKVKDPIYMIGKLQEALKKLPTARGNAVAASLNMSPDITQALRTLPMMDLSKIQALYSPGAIKGMAAMDVRFKQLGTRITAFKDSLALKYGPSLLTVFEDALKVAKLIVSEIESLEKKFGVLAKLGEIFHDVANADPKDVKARQEGMGKLFPWLLSQVLSGPSSGLESTALARGGAGLGGVAINFYGVDFKDAKQVQDKTTQALKDFARQNPAGGPGGN